MRYAEYIDRLQDTPPEMPFLKLAEESPRSLAKDIALVGGGTAVGAGLGYGTAALINKRYGKTIKGMSPEQRLRIAVPAAAGAGGLLALTHVLRQRADSRKGDK
jgi:hypothetical protein